MAVVVGAAVGAAIMYVSEKNSNGLRVAAQDAKIGELTLRLLALSTQDVQTLCGASTHKD